MQNSGKEQTALITFAKEPREGQVKTRLLDSLSAPTVTSLYKAFVKDVLKTALKVQCDQRFIYYTGGPAKLPFLSKFRSQFVLKRQRGKNLGERMHSAFQNSRKSGFCKTVIIGTDCLSIIEKDINTAFQKLSKYDCVLGPCRDGGYYLIGLKVPVRELFLNVNWSTPQVLKATVRRAKMAKKKVFLLNEKEDIDTPASLQRTLRLPHKRFKESAFTTYLFIKENKEIKNLLEKTP